jgi:hypothetical protein
MGVSSSNDAVTTKKWLSEFLLSRLIFSSKSLSQPLYRYEVTDIEYQTLLISLKNDKKIAVHPIHGLQWAACFCLFVSERYRREYDGSEGGWSWQGYDAQIGLKFEHDQRTGIVRKGLYYWGRPLRSREKGADFLGSLFAEGGLPWRLLSADKHGFGRAIKNGLRNYHDGKRSGISLTENIRGFSHSFPSTFRNPETYVLLASVVESLMALAKLHENLELQDDPALYLDQNQPNWRDYFPLPIGEVNAKALVNEWLKKAGIERKKIKEAKLLARNFTAIHALTSSPELFCFETRVFLPEKEEILLESTIPSTRIEMVFFEGENRIFNAGITYGRLDDNRARLSIQFPQNEYKLIRKDIEKPLLLQLYSNGARIAAYYFQNSDLIPEESPLVFTDSDEHELIANASTDTSLSSVLVRCPKDTITEPFLEPCHEDIKLGKWYRIETDTVFKIEQSAFYLRFKDFVDSESPVLRGRLCLYDTTPNLTYYGLPEVDLPTSARAGDDFPKLFLDDSQIFSKSLCGTHTLSVKNADGGSIFRKKIGVLPEDLSINTVCSFGINPAQIHLKTQHDLTATLSNENLIVLSQNSDSTGTCIKMEVKKGSEIPANLYLNLKSHSDSKNKSILMRLPYPHQGATLFDRFGNVIQSNVIALNQLLGMNLQLTSTTGKNQRFYLVAELRGVGVKALRRSYQFDIFNQPISLSLHTFHNDFVQLLSTITDQDALVKVSIETDQLIKQFEIRRYAGRMEQINPDGTFNLTSDVSISNDEAFPIGIHLADPAEKAIPIPKRISAGIATDYFGIPQVMKSKGPWLIAPAESSSLLFRPIIWITDDMSEFQVEDKSQIQSMQKAAAIYHPVQNPEVFNYVMTEMATDMAHSGWVYLSKLKEKYTYLPLSVFMAWHSLSTNNQALAFAVLRLDLDYIFCQKLVNDLAVIWEMVTLDEWKAAVEHCRQYLKNLGVAEISVDILLADKLRSIGNVIPAIKYFSEFLLTRDQDKVHSYPIDATFPIWYQELRRRHCDDDRWPELLRDELNLWLTMQDGAEHFQKEINMEFEKSVVFFPIFMAYMTVGESKIEDLKYGNEETRFALRVLSDFDREAWYEPVYALVLSNLIKKENGL